MTDNELQKIVQLHKEWLLSEGESGLQAVLENADLRQAELSGIDLSYAVLTASNLERANLSGSKLVSADLRKCGLAYANLRHSDLSHANLSCARAQGADFTEARLTGSHLEQVQLDNACLRKVDLAGAQAKGARLNRADLSRASLNDCCLDSAQLRQANLTNASLCKTLLCGADLLGAKVVGVSFDEAIVDDIIADIGLIRLNQQTMTEKNKQTMTERGKLHARRIKNARGLQRVLKIIGYSAIGSAILTLIVAVITGLIDISLMSARQTFLSQTGFAYGQWMLFSGGFTILGVLMLMAQVRLDVITLSPVENEMDGARAGVDNASDPASMVLADKNIPDPAQG